MTRKTGPRTYRGTPRNLALLAHKLQQGELVAVPTETVYGLAANALDATACRKIFLAKDRPSNDPLIVHIHRLEELDELAHTNEIARQLARAYWPGPLTMILPKRSIVPSVVTSGLNSVAVRMPKHVLLRKLLKECGLPLAAPSANPFGYVSPTTAAHVKDGLRARIDYILDGGPAQIGLESTIVDVRDPQHLRVLRPGAITATDLATTLNQTVSCDHPKTGKAKQAQVAPGLLTRHYSPNAYVVLHPKLTTNEIRMASPKAACLFFQKPRRPKAHVYWLDVSGDHVRAARRLFARLRELDARGYQIIMAELAPKGPWAEAINDRLRRAAAQGAKT